MASLETLYKPGTDIKLIEETPLNSIQNTLAVIEREDSQTIAQRVLREEIMDFYESTS